jgi:hypothetical protein
MRLFIVLWICLLGFATLNASSVAADPLRDETLVAIERSIKAGTAFLVKQQQADGAWRSKTYGLLKDGTSLTPLAAWALAEQSEGRSVRDTAFQWVSKWYADQDGQIGVVADLQYPVYAAGLCTSALSRAEMKSEPGQVAAWSRLVQSLQLNPQNGWTENDAQFGGWGYSHQPPFKPAAGETLSPLDEPNLSATVFALETLVISDPEGRLIRPAQQAALRFVWRCQNLSASEGSGGSHESSQDAKFNDGGFHFMQSDPVRNKPGVAGTDSHGRTRFVSYGSATADGLRALLLCGTRRTESRVVAARKWLCIHFEDGSHPGAYPDERSSLKPSLDYYYAASVASAFRAVGIPDDEPLGKGEWARRLSQRLISRQREDGSWSNPAVDVREDDPLVATPLALRSLQICRDELKNIR